MPRKLKTASGVINIRVPKGPPRPELVVLPWLDVKKLLKVGRIHFMPLTDAVATLGPEVGHGCMNSPAISKMHSGER
jgi:hypothetical protein